MRTALAIAMGTLSVAALACGNSGTTAVRADKPAPSGAPTIDVVRVVEQHVDVTLSMPGELDPYEVVAIYPRVTGFVKTIRVDRGSRVRAGAPIAELEAPELGAQRSEAQATAQ